MLFTRRPNAVVVIVLLIASAYRAVRDIARLVHVRTTAQRP
jgi:hypothetical protein